MFRDASFSNAAYYNRHVTRVPYTRCIKEFGRLKKVAVPTVLDGPE